MTDAGVELLGTLPSLMSLDLSGCNIQDQGVAALGNNPRFRDITLAECRNITDLGLQVRTNTITYFPHGGEVGRGVEQGVGRKVNEFLKAQNIPDVYPQTSPVLRNLQFC